MNFGKSQQGRIDFPATLKSRIQCSASLFGEIPLDQSGGVQIENQSRSSMIIWDIGLPFKRMGLIFLKRPVPLRR